MIHLEPFSAPYFDSFIGWIDSRELLVTIAGNVFSYPLTADQLQDYLSNKDSYSFAIVDQPGGKAIGHAELLSMGSGIFKIDKLIIGDASQRGKGTGQQVINQLLAYAFTRLNAQMVELNVFDWNTAGIKCYEKCGFTMTQGKSAAFQVGDKNWTALNMTIDKPRWQERDTTGK